MDPFEDWMVREREVGSDCGGVVCVRVDIRRQCVVNQLYLPITRIFGGLKCVRKTVCKCEGCQVFRDKNRTLKIYHSWHGAGLDPENSVKVKI